MRRTRKPTDTIALQVRMPEAVRRQLASAAEKNARSLNSEILWRLGQTLSEEWRDFIAKVEEREKKRQNIADRLLQDPEFQKRISELAAKYEAEEGER
jgi:hypothetical protein